MKIHVLIDADACPVTDIVIRVSSDYEIEPILFCDTSHRIERENVKTITVDKGRDAVDFALLETLTPNDIVVTQDYGLAAMALAKRGFAIDQNGREFTNENIDSLLYTRFVGQQIRQAGGRTKGPKKRKKENNSAFETKFRQICEQAILIKEK
ncbi:UPF0178 protein [Lysinibacillus alkalisoli]|uniref:UPF0178 protein GCM10007425_11860 n=1 Tax=Lysinibacillus alkalisoli TaxID=1911548 RepID=A0A917LFR9_9BACI|nr:UPF0178 protein [Lysinibacillus alkalisoli]